MHSYANATSPIIQETKGATDSATRSISYGNNAPLSLLLRVSSWL